MHLKRVILQPERDPTLDGFPFNLPVLQQTRCLVLETPIRVIRRARAADAQALQDLQEAKEAWDRCRGRGRDYPCPCWEIRCIRV